MVDVAYALARAELIKSLTVWSGITTSDGASDGTTLIDSDLIGKNDFITEKTILIMSGDAKWEDKGAISFDNATGTTTVQGTGFSAQIASGTIYRILNLSSVEIDVANIQADLGDMADVATSDDMSDITTTSALAKLRLILNRMSQDAFAATIQGASRTALDTMLAQLATYLSAAGAAMSIQVNNQTARTNLEQALEDFFAVIGIDGTNVFNPSLDGSARTDLDALYTALGVLLGTRGVTTPAMNQAQNATDSLTARVKAIEERLGATPADSDDPVHTILGQRDATEVVGFPGTNAIVPILKGLQIAQGLCFYGDITGYTSTTVFASTTLGTFETGFFNGWYCFLIKDDGGAGATPQGARSRVDTFTTTTGAIVLKSALPSAGAVGDQIMLVHPVLLDAWNMRGGTETLESLDDELDAIPDMAKVPDTRTVSVIGTEETITPIGVTGTVPFYVAGIWLGMENMQAGDVVRWRVFIDWDDASIADQLTDDEVWTFGGVQGQKWTYMPLGFWVTYEIAVKVTQLDGTAKELHCVLDTGQRGT